MHTQVRIPTHININIFCWLVALVWWCDGIEANGLHRRCRRRDGQRRRRSGAVSLAPRRPLAGPLLGFLLTHVVHTWNIISLRLYIGIWVATGLGLYQTALYHTWFFVFIFLSSPGLTERRTSSSWWLLRLFHAVFHPLYALVGPFGLRLAVVGRSSGTNLLKLKEMPADAFFFLYFLFRGYGMRKERSCWWSSVGGAADNPDPLKEFPTGILRASFSLHLGTSKMLNCLALSRRKKMWRKYTSHAVHFQIWRQFYASIRIWINCTRNTIVPVERFTIQSIAAVDSIVFLLSFRLVVLETRRRKWEKNRFECHNGTVCYLNQ